MILKIWKKCSRLPFGSKIFSCILSRMVPYTGSIRPHVTHLEPGHVVVEMKDRRRVRNHLNSIHAIALINLGEVATGLAVITSISEDWQAIVTKLEIEYHKKARGALRAEANYKMENLSETSQNKVEVIGEIKNSDQQTVARVKAHWLIGKKNLKKEVS